MIIEMKNICKTFGEETIISNFNLNIAKGEFVTIYGPSGCGKSTLLNILGLLDGNYDGDLKICNNLNPKLNSPVGKVLLREKLSYLFQNFALIEEQSVVNNLLIALQFKEGSKKQKLSLVDEALEKLGLLYLKEKSIYQLSGGEQQRIALARIILKDSPIILADEPTGSLDSKTSDEIIEILVELKNKGKTIIVVSHDPKFKKYSDQVIEL